MSDFKSIPAKKFEIFWSSSCSWCCSCRIRQTVFDEWFVSVFFFHFLKLGFCPQMDFQNWGFFPSWNEHFLAIFSKRRNLVIFSSFDEKLGYFWQFWDPSKIVGFGRKGSSGTKIYQFWDFLWIFSKTIFFLEKWRFFAAFWVFHY